MIKDTAIRSLILDEASLIDLVKAKYNIKLKNLTIGSLAWHHDSSIQLLQHNLSHVE